MRGDGWNTDAGAEVEVPRSRERERPFGGDDGVFLGGAARRAAGGGQRDPDAITDAEAVDSGAERVDDAGAIMVGTVGSATSPAVAPLRDFQSVGFTPDTTRRMRISPAPGSGVGRSSSSSTDGSPGRVYVTALIEACLCRSAL
jgi:hypothetical protein